jgi:hypothetical protein
VGSREYIMPCVVDSFDGSFWTITVLDEFRYFGRAALFRQSVELENFRERLRAAL